MSRSAADRVLDREDFGGVTVQRVNAPALPGDDTTEALFEQAYAVVERAGRARLILNLDGVGYVASVALGKLVTLMHKARAATGQLILYKLSRNVEDVLGLTHLSDILLSYADEQEALRSFR